LWATAGFFFLSDGADFLFAGACFFFFSGAGFFLGFLVILALPSLVAVVGGTGLGAGRLDWMKTQSGSGSAFSPTLFVAIGCKKNGYV